MAACMGRAADQALSTMPRPSADAVMAQCNTQWAAVQQVLPPAVYTQVRGQLKTAVSQRLAATTTTTTTR